MVLLAGAGSACTTMPSTTHEDYDFPKGRAFINKVERPYQVIGEVKERVDFPNVDPTAPMRKLCANYFNKAVQGLVKRARRAGADAVVDVRSVVYLMDGTRESYSTPECSDGGDTGQILVRALAVRWKRKPKLGAKPAARPAPSPSG